MSQNKNILKRLIEKFWFAPADVLSRSAEASIWAKQDVKRPSLDIGCGDGSLSELIFEGKTIDIGVDLTPEGVRQAVSCGIYQEARVADATNLPFVKGSFNSVVSNSTFEHIKKDVKAIKEAHRVLKKGGYLYLTVPTDRLEKAFRKLVKNRQELRELNIRLSHYHYRKVEEWIQILQEAGFGKIEYQYFFSERAVKSWYKLFKLATWKPYKRELWSYLKDSFCGKFVPKKLIKLLLYKYLQGFLKEVFSTQGCLVFIKARKD